MSSARPRPSGVRPYALGFSLQNGPPTPFSARHRAIASDIENHDRELFAALRREHNDPTINLCCRDFLPGEASVWRAMDAPIRPHHVQMRLLLNPDGAIDRQPITAKTLADLAARVSMRRVLSP